ncbi:MAG: RDD family protein [Castellaniella sp.]|uniref:RDD family protein n=1 Tax=Castellaniella sp. TaxID=1955812 RepID=UPI002A361FEC|nr:RDD family protein [Castellaniella sp.]MDY0308937.1 RDD family protein [Castellaniella sp.]
MSVPAPATPTAPPRLRRFACMMYEGVLLFGVVFLAGYLFDTLTQSRSGLMLRHGRQAFLFLAIGLYFLASWHRGGQTLPMKTWNIRVTDRNSQPLKGMRMLLRYVLLWPLPLLTALAIAGLSRATGWASFDLLIVCAPFSVFLWTWIDPQGQFLHDRLLGTELHDLRHTAPAA